MFLIFSSGLSGHGTAVFSITGEGFGTTDCQNKVMIGDATECTVTASSDTSLTCNIADLSKLNSLTSQPIKVNVFNRYVMKID